MPVWDVSLSLSYFILKAGWSQNKWEKWKLWGKQQCLGSWLQSSREGHHYPGVLGMSALSALFLFCWSGSGVKKSRFFHTTFMRLKAAFLVGKSSVWVRRKRSFYGNAASGWDQEVITWSPQGGLIFFSSSFHSHKEIKTGLLVSGESWICIIFNHMGPFVIVFCLLATEFNFSCST